MWIDNSIYTVRRWSVYKKHTRTNNDVEGWHYKLNTTVNKGKTNIYQLIHILHVLASEILLQCTLICANKIKKKQENDYMSKQAALTRLWNLYDDSRLKPVFKRSLQCFLNLVHFTFVFQL